MARRRANQEQLALALDPRVEMPPIYFASGTNHAGEVKGFAAVGQPMGAAVDKCNEPCLRAYEDLAEAGIPVFMDSGAFSEVEPQFRTRGSAKEFVGFRDKRPITPADWRERLDIYHRLAATLGPLLYVVRSDSGSIPTCLRAHTSMLRRRVGRAARALGPHVALPRSHGVHLGSSVRRPRYLSGMSKHYEVVQYDDASTMPTRRVVYSGSNEEVAKDWMATLAFARSHELHVDGKLDQSVTVVSAGPRSSRLPRLSRFGDA